MNLNERPKRSVTKPLLKKVVDLDKANAKNIKQIPKVESKPLDPPALYEDAGEGYNPDFTFPQE
ncbi:MAG: hypothetical protein JO097_12725 [Acidobacteriaceae bacterium]|nr:hypothetical protein [Acidobacteriaceae bacterium]MBV9294160.1 hypothetical protein [Acidobacteriaceae bacterium]MBV9766378.1 hypothetical protein [Acidobacteriaceae bacterium]